MPDHILHGVGILAMPIVEDLGNANDIFSMHVHSQVGCLISLVIAFLVASSKDFVNDVLNGNMALHLSKSNGLGTFGDGSLGEMLPQVAIRCGLPVIFNWFAYSELVQDVASLVYEGLAVRANMDRAIGNHSHYCSSKFGPCGTAPITPDGGEKHSSIMVLLVMG